MNVSKNHFKYHLVFSLAIISLLCIPNWALARTYYVATNGNDNNSGTEAQPWLTLSKADSAASSGDIVYVKEGTYSGLGVTKSGITYRSHPSNTTRPKTGQWYFESASNVTIDGFVVTTGNQGGAFVLNHANKNNIIRNCEMYECGSIGVDVTGGSDYNIIEDCVIHDCWYAFHTSGSGCRGNIFRRNHCYNHSDGINVSPSAYDTKIIGNIIHDCDDDGIHLFDDGKAEVSGNLVYNCKGVAFWVNGNAGIISKNNTIIGVPNAKWGYVVWIEKSGHIFKNNIVYVNAADMQMLTGGGTGDINYNCFWNPQGQVSKVGANDIIADPLFVNVVGNDYHLKSNSPCIGAGEGGVDMGAYGVGSEPVPALSVSPTSHDFGTSETNYQFTVKNTEGETLSWNASESLDWLSLSKTSGSLGAGISENVTATVSRTGKSPGTYNGTISLTSNGGNQDVSVSIIVPNPEVPDPPYDNPGESKPLSDEPANDDPPDVKDNRVRNRPNPFRAGKQVTLIEYNLEQPSNVTITIYNLLGQEVWGESYELGENGGRKVNSVPWDGRSLSGEVVGNGGYICRIWVEREKRAMRRKIAIAK